MTLCSYGVMRIENRLRGFFFFFKRSQERKLVEDFVLKRPLTLNRTEKTITK